MDKYDSWKFNNPKTCRNVVVMKDNNMNDDKMKAVALKMLNSISDNIDQIQSVIINVIAKNPNKMNVKPSHEKADGYQMEETVGPANDDDHDDHEDMSELSGDSQESLDKLADILGGESQEELQMLTSLLEECGEIYKESMEDNKVSEEEFSKYISHLEKVYMSLSKLEELTQNDIITPLFGFLGDNIQELKELM